MRDPHGFSRHRSPHPISSHFMVTVWVCVASLSRAKNETVAARQRSIHGNHLTVPQSVRTFKRGGGQPRRRTVTSISFYSSSKDEEGNFLYRNLRKLGFRPHFNPFSHRNLGARSARERKFEHFHRSCVGSFSLPTWPFEAINTPLESPRRKGEDEREKGRRERGSLGRISSPKARCLHGQNWCRTIHGIGRGQTH